MGRPMMVLLICANLASIRLVCGQLAGKEAAAKELAANESSSWTGSVEALERINSLDFGHPPSGSKWPASEPSPVGAQIATSTATTSTQSSGGASPKRRAKSSPGRGGQSAGAAAAAASSLLVGLLRQLESVDLGRLFAGSPSWASPRNGAKVWLEQTNRSQLNESSKGDRGKQNGQGVDKESRLNVSALSAEGANLLSITKQLVKLARNQVLSGGPMGMEQWFGSPGSSFGGGGMGLPSSLMSAASSAFNEALEPHHQQHAMGKSDWFWLVAPAVIVIGAAVIVIPLVAAYLVSNAMSQNTFTVSAGRRRRKRAAQEAGLGSVEALLELQSGQRLVDRLSQFHGALESVARRLRRSEPQQMRLHERLQQHKRHAEQRHAEEPHARHL